MDKIKFEYQYATFEQSAALQQFKIPIAGYFKWIAYNEGKSERKRLVNNETAHDTAWKLYQTGRENVLRFCEAYSCAELEIFRNFIEKYTIARALQHQYPEGDIFMLSCGGEEISLGTYSIVQGAHWRAQFVLECLKQKIIQPEQFSNINQL